MRHASKSNQSIKLSPIPRPSLRGSRYGTCPGKERSRAFRVSTVREVGYARLQLHNCAHTRDVLPCARAVASPQTSLTSSHRSPVSGPSVRPSSIVHAARPHVTHSLTLPTIGAAEARATPALTLHMPVHRPHAHLLTQAHRPGAVSTLRVCCACHREQPHRVRPRQGPRVQLEASGGAGDVKGGAVRALYGVSDQRLCARRPK